MPSWQIRICEALVYASINIRVLHEEIDGLAGHDLLLDLVEGVSLFEFLEHLLKGHFVLLGKARDAPEEFFLRRLDAFLLRHTQEHKSPLQPLAGILGRGADDFLFAFLEDVGGDAARFILAHDVAENTLRLVAEHVARQLALDAGQQLAHELIALLRPRRRSSFAGSIRRARSRAIP